MNLTNDRVAMVFCPSWCNVPPVGLAYIKGAVKNREIRCFDFNHQLIAQQIPDYKSSFQSFLPGFRPFMFKNPNFADFEQAASTFASIYCPVLEQWAKQLESFAIVGFSVNQENILASSVLARLLRRKFGTLCLAGGPSMNMDDGVFAEYLLKDRTFSYVVLGIAEDIIEELLDRLISGQTVADLPKLVFLGEDQKIVRTRTNSPGASNLFSPPNYDDFVLNDYYQGRADWLQMYAVTGCKGRCKFCTINEFYPKYFAKSLESITREMHYLRGKYASNRIFFSDGMFLGNREAALALFDFAIANDFRLGIQMRVMPYWHDEELVKKAAQCVFFLQIGFESASPNVRRAMGKFVNEEITMAIFRLFYKYNIPIHTNIITGYPNETEEDFQMTLNFMREYLQQPNRLHIGVNSFFLSNNFPIAEYHISFDDHGHWQSDIVTIVDRVARVSQICNLAHELGLPRDFVYATDNVEGVPLQLNERRCCLDGAKIDFINEPSSRTGWIDSISTWGEMLIGRGWARDPRTGAAATSILLVDGDQRMVAVIPVRERRADVAEAFGEKRMENCGWSFNVDMKTLGKISSLNCYTLVDRQAYRLENSPFPFGDALHAN